MDGFGDVGREVERIVLHFANVGIISYYKGPGKTYCELTDEGKERLRKWHEGEDIGQPQGFAARFGRSSGMETDR
jgi:hypothetical protein